MSNYEHAVNSSEFEMVRKAMIDRGTGEFTLVAWIPIESEVSAKYTLLI